MSLSKAPGPAKFLICREKRPVFHVGVQGTPGAQERGSGQRSSPCRFAETLAARRGGLSLSHSLPGLAGPAPLQLVLVQCNQTEMTVLPTGTLHSN